MLIQEGMGIQEKLEILADAAKYDVACTSSGVERKNKPGTLGNAVSAGLCHSFAADGRCSQISVSMIVSIVLTAVRMM